MASRKVIFKKIKQASYNALTSKDNDTLYFLIDSKELYLGSTKHGDGNDLNVVEAGSGNFIKSITYDASLHTATVTKGEVIEDTQLAAELARLDKAFVKTIKAPAESAIHIDNTDAQNPIISLNISKDTQGNVTFYQNAEGLYGVVDTSKIDVGNTTTVATADKFLAISPDGELSSTVDLTLTKDDSTGNTKLNLVGKDNKVVKSLDLSSAIAAGELLQTATLAKNTSGNQILTLTFKTESGTKDITCDLSALVDAYKAAANGGLSLDSSTNEFSIANTVAPVDMSTTAKLTGNKLSIPIITYDTHGLVTAATTVEVDLSALATQGPAANISGSINGDNASAVVTSVTASGTTVSGTTLAVDATYDASTATDETKKHLLTAGAVADMVNNATVTWIEETS